MKYIQDVSQTEIPPSTFTYINLALDIYTYHDTQDHFQSKLHILWWNQMRAQWTGCSPCSLSSALLTIRRTSKSLEYIPPDTRSERWRSTDNGDTKDPHEEFGCCGGHCICDLDYNRWSAFTLCSYIILSDGTMQNIEVYLVLSPYCSCRSWNCELMLY